MALGPDADRGAQRRRGRPLRLPEDHRPFASDTVDCDARVAWAVLTNRLLHPDQRLRERAAVVEGLAQEGVAADPSRLSRWESGQQQIPLRVLLGYERVLRLPALSLLTVTRCIRRVAGVAGGDIDDPRVYAEDARRHGRDLETLLEEIYEGEEVGGDAWLGLSALLGSFDRVFLPRQTWERLSDRLLRELARTAGVDHRRRMEACMLVMAHPQGQRHLLQALGRWLVDPHVQLAGPLIGLLQAIDSPTASRLVMQLLGAPVRQVREGASAIAAAKLRGGHFAPDDLERLEAHARMRLVASGSLHDVVDALDLLAHLPQELADRTLAVVRGARRRAVLLAREQALLVPAGKAVGIASEIAEAAQSRVRSVLGERPDPMLGRLVREALFHVHYPRRDAAARLLAVSPFRDGLADATLDAVQHPDALVASQAWQLAFRLGHGGRPDDVLPIVLAEKRPEIRAEGLVGLGLGRGTLSAAEQETVVDLAHAESNGRVRDGALFALGMRGPEGLARLSVPSEANDPETVAAARWWRQLGGHLVDEDAWPVPQRGCS